MGAMDGINEAGLAVALLADNETPEPEPTGASGGTGRAAGRPLPARHLRHRRRSEGGAAARPSTTTSSRPATSWSRTAPGDPSSGSTRPGATVSDRRADPTTDGRLVCTNHLLHRWPDPAALPDDAGPIGTAALTYHRWRTLTAAMWTAPSSIATTSATSSPPSASRPDPEARTFWHAPLRRGRRLGGVSFYRHDATAPASTDTTPVRARRERVSQRSMTGVVDAGSRTTDRHRPSTARGEGDVDDGEHPESMTPRSGRSDNVYCLGASGGGGGR